GGTGQPEVTYMRCLWIGGRPQPVCLDTAVRTAVAALACAAALSGDSQKLMLYDFKTQKWAVWADEGHTVGFPNWSRDSRYIYFDWFFGKDQSYRRVKGGGNKSQEMFISERSRRYFYLLWNGR